MRLVSKYVPCFVAIVNGALLAEAIARVPLVMGTQQHVKNLLSFP